MGVSSRDGSCRRYRATCLLVAGLAACSIARAPRLLADESSPVVAASEGQAARSLRSELERLCRDHGIALHFNAPDSRIEGVPPGTPIHDALERMLRDYNYVLTFRRAADATLHVAALDVLGDPKGARAPRRPPPPPPRFAVHAGLLDAAFASTDGSFDDRAVDALIADIRDQPARVRGLLATDAAVLAEGLRKYPHAGRALERIARREDVDDRVRAKLAEIVTALDGSGASGASPRER